MAFTGFAPPQPQLPPQPGGFDPLGGPPLPPPGVPPAVAARQRKDAKKDEKRKIGGQVLSAVAQATGQQPTPPPSQPAPPRGTPAANSTSDAAPQEAAPPPVPAFTPAQYKAPNKGLEYLALGIGLLFPGAPIARAAAGFAQGLQTGAERKYERGEQQAEQTYQGQLEARRGTMEQQKVAFDNAVTQYQARQDLRSRGIDPATNQPFVLPPQLQRILPPGQNRQPGAEDYFRHETQLANFYDSVGAAAIAKDHRTFAADYQRQAIDNANNARALAVATANQNRQDQRQQNQFAHSEYIQQTGEAHSDALQQAGFTHSDLLQQRTFAHQDAKAILGDPAKQGAVRDEALRASSTFRADWIKATKPGDTLDKNGDPLPNPKPAAISGALVPALGKIFSQIDRDTDPASAAEYYAKSVPNQTAKQLIIQRGLAADLNRRAQGLPVLPHAFAPVKEARQSPTQGLPATRPDPRDPSGKTMLHLHNDGKYYPEPEGGGSPQASAPFASPAP